MPLDRVTGVQLDVPVDDADGRVGIRVHGLLLLVSST